MFPKVDHVEMRQGGDSTTWHILRKTQVFFNASYMDSSPITASLEIFSHTMLHMLSIHALIVHESLHQKVILM